jgi:hypothetical protein
MPPKAGNQDEKMKKMEAKFAQLDADGDGSLDVDELGALLKRGNPNFSDREVKDLYAAVDSNHDGRVDFQEFLRYIYKSERTSGGRHERLHAAGGVGVDDTEGDWSACKAVFTAFAGQDMDGKEFAKFCKDNKLVGHGMQKTDVDLIFAKVVPKGKRRMDFNMFQEACRHIASKRNQSNGDIQNIVASSEGPTLVGTKTEYSKFYDDKSTYTGAATYNEKFDGVDPNAVMGRHEKQQAATDAAIHGGAAEADWGECSRVYSAFAGAGGTLEGREFKKMCDDIKGLIGSGFTKNDVDVVFTQCKSKQANYINFDGFKECVRRIAAKRSTTPSAVQEIVARSDGPTVHATKTDAVRFYDDKSTYTGAAAEVFGRDGHDDGRHERLQEQNAKAAQGSEGEHPWEPCTAAYMAFAGPEGSMDGREFFKFCGDAKLIDNKGFTKQDVDVVFAAAMTKRGGKKLDSTEFQIAVRKIAEKKGVPTYEIQKQIETCEGPHLNATKAEYSKFYDDKTTYTGTATENENLQW